jgi:hypothetical protein
MKVSPPLGSDPVGGCSPRDVVPHLKPLGHDLAIGRGRKPVASRAEVWGEHTLGGKEPLGLSGRLEPLPPSFALTRRLRGVLGAMMEIAGLPMFHTREELSCGGSRALQLVRDDAPGSILAPLEERVEASLRRLLVPPALPQAIEDLAIRIDRPPARGPLTPNRQKDRLQMPLITSSGMPAPELIGRCLTELLAPLPNGVVRHHDPAGEPELVDITGAEAEPVIQPHALADAFGWTPLVCV